MGGIRLVLYFVLGVSAVLGVINSRKAHDLGGGRRWRSSSVFSIVFFGISLITDFVSQVKLADMEGYPPLSRESDAIFFQAAALQGWATFFVFIAAVGAAVTAYLNMAEVKGLTMNIKDNKGVIVGRDSNAPITQAGRDAQTTTTSTSNVPPELITALSTLRAYGSQLGTPDGLRLAQAADKASEEAQKPSADVAGIAGFMSHVVVLAQKLATLAGPAKDAYDLINEKIG